MFAFPWQGHAPRTALIAALLVTAVHCAPPATNAQVSNRDGQIAGAVQAAPESFREGARVLGFAADGSMVEIRPGTNDMVCLADNPAREDWSVACYHASLDPFMAMGRDLRSQGVTDATEIRNRRFQAADDGTLAMPDKPAALYVLTGDGFDMASGEVQNGFLRYVLYSPYATAESTGLTTTPDGSVQPWLMFPGTAGAHIMITPTN